MGEQGEGVTLVFFMVSAPQFASEMPLVEVVPGVFMDWTVFW